MTGSSEPEESAERAGSANSPGTTDVRGEYIEGDHGEGGRRADEDEGQYIEGTYGAAGTEGGLPEVQGDAVKETGRFVEGDLGSAGSVQGRTAESETGQYTEGDYGAAGTVKPEHGVGHTKFGVLTGETMAPETDLDRFLEGLDYAMFIVTVASETESAPASRSGCLVGFVTQVSIDPPRLLVCISKINHSYRLASGAQSMGVHVVGSDQHGLAELFGGETGDDIDKFAACAWSADPRGVPVLTDCPRRMIADVLDRVDLGDHVGFVLAPTEVHAQADAVPLYFSQIRGLQAGHPA